MPIGEPIPPVPSGDPVPTTAAPMEDKIALARSKGLSWDDIGSRLAPMFEQARNAGLSIQDIDKRLGVQDPTPTLVAVSQHLEEVYKDNKSIDVNKVRSLYAQAMKDSQVKGSADFATYLAHIADRVLNAPGNVVESAAKGAVEGAKRGWGEGPVYEPKPAGESALGTLGRILSIDLGAASRTMSAGFGAVQGAIEPVLGRDTAAMLESELGSPGRLAHGIPEVPALPRDMRPATQAAVNALTTHLPDKTELVDGALAIQHQVNPPLRTGTVSPNPGGGFDIDVQGTILFAKTKEEAEKIAANPPLTGNFIFPKGYTGEPVPGQTKIVADNLANAWAKTGKTPVQLTEEARTNPALQSDLLSPQPSEPARGSSRTPDGANGEFVIPKQTLEPSGPTKLGSSISRSSDPVTNMMTQLGRHGDDPAVRSFIEDGGGTLNPKEDNWCAAFINSSLAQAGIKGTGSDVATSFLDWGTKVTADQTQRGDVVVVPRGRGPGETGGHVGLATGNTRIGPAGIDVEIVSGNDNGQVQTSWRNVSSIEIRRSDGKGADIKGRGDNLSLISQLESTDNPSIRDSPTGARGQFQIDRPTAETLGVDYNRLGESAYGRMAAEKNLERIKAAGLTRTEDILVAWNRGLNGAKKWIDEGRKYEDLPPETQDYLAKAQKAGANLNSEDELARTLREREGEVGAVGNLPEAAKKSPLEEAEDEVNRRFQKEVDDPWQSWGNWGRNAYRELFAGDANLMRAEEAVTGKGMMPADVSPKALRVLAENSDATVQATALEGKMTNLRNEEVGPGFKQIVHVVDGADKKSFQAYMVARGAVEKGMAEEGHNLIVEQAKSGFAEAYENLVTLQRQSAEKLRDAGVLDNDALAKRHDELRYEAFTEDKDGKLQHPFKTIVQRLYADDKIARQAIADRAAIDMLERNGLAAKSAPHAIKLELSPDVTQAMVKAGLDPTDTAFWVKTSGGALREDEVPIFRDGKMERWQAFKENGKVDQEITNFLRGFDVRSLNFLQGLMKPFASFQRASIALNPLFKARLLMMDMPWQFITKPGVRNSLADYLVGLGHQVVGSDAYSAAMESGAFDHVFSGLSKQEWIRDLMTGREDPAMPRSAWNAVTTSLEKLRAAANLAIYPLRAFNPIRSMQAGRYIRGVQAGETAEQASYEASKATFHSSHFGGPTSRVTNQLIPFTAAYLNGIEQTARALFIGKTPEGNAIKVWQTWMKGAAAVTVPMMANYAISKDEQWYKDLPDWKKNTGLNIRPPGSDISLYIPFPPMIGFIFGGLPRMMTEAAMKHDTDGLGKKALEGLAASFLPATTLLAAGNFATPILEHIAKYSFFTGRPMPKPDLEDSVLPQEASTKWSSGAARWLSQYVPDVLRAGPAVIDNYIQGWGGTLGAAAVHGADLMFHTGSRAGNPPELSVRDMPLMGSWLATTPDANAQPILDFYDKMTEFNQVHGSFLKAAQEGNGERVKELLRKYGPNEITAHSLKLKPEEKLLIEASGAREIFRSTIQQAHDQADMATVNHLLTTEKALRNQRMYADQVYHAAAGEPIDIRDENLTSTGQKQTLSPTDKSQLLRRVYTGMRITAEAGLADMKKLRM